jgi:hypothetical protein
MTAPPEAFITNGVQFLYYQHTFDTNKYFWIYTQDIPLTMITTRNDSRLHMYPLHKSLIKNRVVHDPMPIANRSAITVSYAHMPTSELSSLLE